MTELLRKLAAELRARAVEDARNRATRCAKIAQAAIGLELLRKKIGG